MDHGTDDSFPGTNGEAIAEGRQRYDCPECGASFDDATEPANGLLQCPQCGSEFFAPEPDSESPPSSEGLSDDAPPAHKRTRAGDRHEELDSLRIRAVTAPRRALYRAQGYWLIGAIVLFSAAFGFTVRRVYGQGWEIRPPGYWPFALLSLVGVFYCLRRFVQIKREADAPPPPEDLPEPDFSTLSDGSHHARNLEAIDADDRGPRVVFREKGARDAASSHRRVVPNTGFGGVGYGGAGDGGGGGDAGGDGGGGNGAG